MGLWEEDIYSYEGKDEFIYEDMKEGVTGMVIPS